MKKLILLELALLFLATTFLSDNPPGWYQQVLPRNKIINDIYFADRLNGWAVTSGGSSSTDTAFIFNTTNGGNNWLIQKTGIEQLDAIQFIDINTGYATGKLFSGTSLSIYKTTNAGINWQGLNNITGLGPTDLFFVNKDTGWISAINFSLGGLYKTTNGGANWVQQLNASNKPSKLFFINRDTGWVACNDTQLFRTTNGGTNWNLQFTSASTIEAIFFLTPFKGWLRGGTTGTGNGICYTINGGFNWTNSQGETGGFDIKMVNDSIGWAGGGSFSNRILKTTDGGRVWGYQNIPIIFVSSVSTFEDDTLKSWAARNGVVHTTDGGGTLIMGLNQIGTEIPKDYFLYQNYPNPFNGNSKIKFKISKFSDAVIKVFDITGKEIKIIFSGKLTAGEYETDFSANDFSSGIYFYSLFADDKLIETKKMILIK